MQRYLRSAAIAVVLLLLLAIPVTAVLARSYFLAPTSYPAPDQPIAFPHTIHVRGLGLECTFCHRMASPEALGGINGDTPQTGPSTEVLRGSFTEGSWQGAYVPALEQCMFCHNVIPTTDRPELQRLVSSFTTGNPIEWKRVYQMPDHVHFPHPIHIDAGITCSTCHGDVGSMTQVRRARDLRMGDCIDCHQQNGARTDCAVCHY
jgi:hypothetical protein